MNLVSYLCVQSSDMTEMDKLCNLFGRKSEASRIIRHLIGSTQQQVSTKIVYPKIIKRPKGPDTMIAVNTCKTATINYPKFKKKTENIPKKRNVRRTGSALIPEPCKVHPTRDLSGEKRRLQEIFQFS